MTTMSVILMMMMMVMKMVVASDKIDIYDPCDDAVVTKSDGFTFGLAFSTKDSFFFNQTQLSPCDKRLSLLSLNAQLAVFRPKVDELSLLTISNPSFFPVMHGGYMVAFAGRKYAARSLPVLVADSTHTITGFTLILEFQKGTLQNLYWKRNGCDACSGKSSFVCLDQQDCAIENSQCKGHGGSVDCSIGIQLAFSGTDKNHEVLNSWYEVNNLRQYSLYGLFSDLKDALTDAYSTLF